MYEPSPDESSIATAGAARTAELARDGLDPVAERRRAANRERKRRASAKALPAESQRAPPSPELRSRRLGARNGDEPTVWSSVKPSIPANINLIDRTRQVWQRALAAACPSRGRVQRARSQRPHTHKAPLTEAVPRSRDTNQAIRRRRPKPDAAGTQSIKVSMTLRSRTERTPPALAIRFSLGGTTKRKDQQHDHPGNKRTCNRYRH
jgi:hypothetical protein